MSPVTYVEAVRSSLRHALATDESVVLLGEDIGEGGGAFLATKGLLDEFGPERVRDTPISEGAFTGVAVGLALEGYRPIVEYQFADFMTCGMTQIVNVVAKQHFRTGHSVPMVIRAPSGGGFAGGPFHSQSPEAWFLRVPGLKVCCPATVEDVGPLMLAAIADPNPVIVFEQKHLYTRCKGEAAIAPVGALEGAAIRRAGNDATLVTYGATLWLALEAADELAEEGADVEVIDLRVLCPLDFETVAASVTRTGRCLIAHEDHAEFGVAAELGSRLSGELFESLDAPVGRVGAAFHPIPFSPPLEGATLPSSAGIAARLRELLSY